MKIFKYPLRLSDLQEVALPRDARVLSVGLDPNGLLCLWALVNPSFDVVPRQVRIIGTGNEVPTEALSMMFAGTVTTEYFVWHVFVG